jgi:AcrR family transcriptional regulator
MGMDRSITIDLRRQRREYTQRAIMDTALALVAEHGLHQLSLREVARRVGYSPAAMYEYFASKEALIQALADEGDLLLRARLSTTSEDLPPGERVISLGLAYVDFARTHPEHFHLMFSELSTSRTSLNDPLDEEKPYYPVAKAVADGIAAGEFGTRPGYGLGEITYGLWALAHGIASLQRTKLRHVVDDFPPIDRAVLETLVSGLGGDDDRT